jgi:hypothetical protein
MRTQRRPGRATAGSPAPLHWTVASSRIVPGVDLASASPRRRLATHAKQWRHQRRTSRPTALATSLGRTNWRLPVLLPVRGQLAQFNLLSSEQSGDGRAMDLESPRQLPDRLSLVVCGDELRDLCLAEAVLALSRALSVLPSSLRRGSRTQVAEPRSIPKKVRIEAHKLRYLAPGQAPFVVVL